VIERRLGLIGAFAAGRPALTICVYAAAAAALAAAGFRDAPPSFGDAALSFFSALAICVIMPAALAAMSPRNIWLRIVYAGFALAAFLAIRRVLLQSGLASLAPFNVSLGLIVGGAAAFALSLGGPGASAALRLGLVGAFAALLGVGGALGFVALEIVRRDAPEAGPSLAFTAAAALGAASPLAAGYAQRFAEGGSGATAAAYAARDGAALALFAACIAASMAASDALFAREPAFWPSFNAFAIALVATLAPVFATPASLSLKAPDEGVAHRENLRQRALAPFMRILRLLLPPSTALATIAILSIAAIVVVFEGATPPAPREAFLIAIAGLAASLIFVSIRTALLLSVLLALALAFASSLHGFFPAATNATARLLAISTCAFALAPLCLAWRDARDPRRKAREVMMRAYAAGAPASALSACLGAAGLAAAASAGVFAAGGGAALFAIAMALFSIFVAPAAMIAISALFGRG
jgi:hypothetical protein